MACCLFHLWEKLAFWGHDLPDDKRRGENVILEEGQNVAKITLRISLDASDSSVTALASAVTLRRNT